MDALVSKVTAMRARYILRFDDICPTMNWPIWEEIETALRRAHVRPILAVVPNSHHNSKLDDPNREIATFWERVRSWQSLNWTIALHGYEHLPLTKDAGLIGINPRSEFAGVEATEQRRRLTQAMKIFADQGVTPRTWVAPFHSFDETTISLLQELGVSTISDGFSLFPYRDEKGTFWVPQQLWRFRPLPFGIWTVCLHHSPWDGPKLDRFKQDLKTYGDSIIGLDQVEALYGRRRRRLTDDLFTFAFSLLLKRRRAGHGE